MRAATTRRTAPHGADFAALIAPVSISLFDAALRGAVQRAV